MTLRYVSPFFRREFTHSAIQKAHNASIMLNKDGAESSLITTVHPLEDKRLCSGTSSREEIDL